MASAKNFGLSASAIDLGLGDMLKSDLEMADEERKKKLREAQRAQQMGAGGAGLGPGTMSLYGAAGGFSI